MKRRITYNVGNKKQEKYLTYIPLRYILAILITLLEIISIILVVFILCYYVPYFYVAALLTTIVCELSIISSDDNPDYKVPWMLVVLVLPIVGFMLYFIFASRKLKPKFIKKLNKVQENTYDKTSLATIKEIEELNPIAASQVKMLCNIANTNVFKNTKQTYFDIGEKYFESLILDLKRAKKFIYMEYFIIEEGIFWNTILEILEQKVKENVEIKIIYDDIGCISTLPGNYYKQLQRRGIEAVSFSKLRGSADSEFNNRSHRKIAVIDGYIGYTGGINIADEYINQKVKYGHWKDGGIRLEGEAVYELTKLFMIDFGINYKVTAKFNEDLYPKMQNVVDEGYVIPFGDGPKPLYERRVGKSVIQNLLNSATNYAYITTPYLIIDNDLCVSIENASLRGVDVRIIVPHIPDKKLVFTMTRSYYKRLMDAGVRIYEYKPGFIHAKNYIVDDKYAMVGTINLDYRSLVHHFENGVWMYRTQSIHSIKEDIEFTLSQSIEVTSKMLKTKLPTKFIRALVRIFAPLL